MKKIIIELEKYGEDVPTEKVFALAEEEGIEREKAEDRTCGSHTQTQDGELEI